jgi:hypothetical protein
VHDEGSIELVRWFRVAGAPDVLADGATAAAIADLQQAARERGISVGIVGRLARDLLTVAVASKPTPSLAHEDAFRISPRRGNLIVEGGSRRAFANALYWLADRLRVVGRLPSEAVERTPVFDLRYAHLRFPTADTDDAPYVDEAGMTRALDGLADDLRHCLAMGITHVALAPREVVVPCDHPTHGPRAEAYAPYYEEALRMAHALHLKVVASGDEFLYYDGALEQASARLSVEDPDFWRMLQGKYRRLLARFPDLDGVAMRVGEMLPMGPFHAFDAIHDAPHLSVAEKYRRFVTAIHEVVVGEFGKLYLHRTWAVSEHEVHSQEKEFEAAFRDVPRENLVISIKLTQTDQWQYQAYNPTFGVTDHQTAVEVEIGRAYHHGQRIPDYVATYVEPGLRYAHSRGATGIMIGAVISDGQTWADASAYAVARLAWGERDVRQLARDWAARRFGKAAARPLGDALMLSDTALRKGLYLMPYASTHAWNPLAHLMAYMWVVGGNPTLDQGLGHMAFLREQYWFCRPYLSDTERELDEGNSLWAKMMALLAKAEPHIKDTRQRKWARESFDLGAAFIALNVAHLKAVLRYFQYEETLAGTARGRAAAALRALRLARERYIREGGTFDTIGIAQFMTSAEQGLRSKRAARAMLSSPSERDLLKSARRAMEEEARALRSAKENVKVLEWRANVDGREVIRLRGDKVEMKHDMDEPALDVQYTVCGAVPEGWRAVVKPVRCRDYAYVAEQPSRANGRTVTICVEDPRDGRDIYEIQVYAIPPESGGRSRQSSACR